MLTNVGDSSLENIQTQLNEKLENAFDTRHIYQFFSTFLDTINSQKNEIHELRKAADLAHAKIDKMGSAIRMMELNIHGYSTFDGDNDDLPTKIPRPIKHIDQIKEEISTESGGKTDSALENVLTRTNEWDSKDEDSNAKKQQVKRRTSKAQIYQKVPPPDKDTAWKFKKRRVIRHVSRRLSDQLMAKAAASSQSTSALTTPRTRQPSVAQVNADGVQDQTSQQQDTSPQQPSHQTSVHPMLVDPKQVLAYRIDDLEQNMQITTSMINAQRAALESVPGRINNAVPHDLKEKLVQLESTVAMLKEQLETQAYNSLYQARQEPMFVDDFVTHKREREVFETATQTEVEVVVQVEPPKSTFDFFSEDESAQEEKAKKDSKRNSVRMRDGASHDEEAAYEESLIVKFNDENELPPETLSVIASQVCGSESMKKLLDRVVKSTEKMVDHALKRMPKPSTPLTSEDILTDHNIAAIARAMVNRGLLDDLRYVKSEHPTPRPQQMLLTGNVSTSESDGPMTRAEVFEVITRSLEREERRRDEAIREAIECIPTYDPVEVAFQSNSRDLAKQMMNDIMDDASGMSQTPVRMNSPQVVVEKEAVIGERAKNVLEQRVEVLELDKASRKELDDLSRGIISHVSIEVHKLSMRCDEMLHTMTTDMQEKHVQQDNSIRDVSRALADLEANINIQLQQSHKLLKKKDEEAWKSDLLKVSQSINKAREDQRTVAKMLVEELENLQKEMKNRVDERRLEHLAATIEEKLQREMGQSVSGINLSMAKIVSAVRSKADRSETEALIQNKLNEAEESLRNLQEDEPAGAYKCISCGSAGKKMTPNASLESLSFASALMTQSMEVKRNRGGDLEQTAAVLNGQAGLRPLSRQQKPLVPKSFTPASAPARDMSKEVVLEPLYRRAKHANQIREIPKIPNITFGAGNSNQYKLDERESVQLPNLGSQSAKSANSSFSGGL